MMKKFSDWVNEAKKGTNDSLPPTATSSPIRGANQDQSGENDKNNVADYTISDSTVIDNWENNSPEKRKNAVKKLMALNARHGAKDMPHEKIKEELELDEVSIIGKSKINNFTYSKKGKENRASYIAKQRATYDPVEKKKAETKSKNLAMLKAVSAKKKANEETDPGFKLDEISPELVGKVNKARTIDKKPSKTPEAEKTLRNAVNKAWIKSKVAPVKEGIVAGVGQNRIKPVNMAQKTGGTKEPNAPSNVKSMQSAANQRVIQLDKAAQQEKDASAKNREMETAKRQREAANRDTERNSKANNNYQTGLTKRIQKEELELDEARGRPKKAAGEESTNIIMQLRKVITLRGQEPVTFANGARVRLNPGTAHRLLATYDNLKTSGEKYAFSARIHKSPESLRDVVAGKKEVVKPKISLAGKITGTQNANHS